MAMNHPYARPILLGTVFVTGTAVLILEILAVRLLSPQFGTSMFVLSSVLTIILAALATGYYWGGRVADRFPHPLPLYTIIATGGLAIALTYTLGKFILPFSGAALPLTVGPLLVALLLFFIPAFLLGTDSPYVIKILTSHDSPGTSGTTTGTVFFWSTIGSIVGSLSAGFFFIPFVGIETTLLGMAGLLAISATIAATLLTSPQERRTPRFYLLCAVATSTAIIAIAVHHFPDPAPYPSEQRTLYDADHQYGHIRIYEQEFSLTRPPARFLKRDVNSESAIFQDSYDHPFVYTRFSDLFPQLHRGTTTNFLLLGGGAYSIARSLLAAHPALHADVVEIEPALFPLATRYFDLQHLDRLTNHVADARVFIQASSEKKYDYIFMDTFNSGLYIPPHLTTIEFWRALRGRLAADGLLMINFIGATGLSGTTLTDSFTKTLRTVFPNVRAFSEHPHRDGALKNIVFIADATDRPLDIANVTLPLAPDLPATPLADLELPLVARDPQAQVIFTDDRSAAEYLIATQLRVAR
jgi:spermidine synthase